MISFLFRIFIYIIYDFYYAVLMKHINSFFFHLLILSVFMTSGPLTTRVSHQLQKASFVSSPEFLGLLCNFTSISRFVCLAQNRCSWDQIPSRKAQHREGFVSENSVVGRETDRRLERLRRTRSGKNPAFFFFYTVIQKLPQSWNSEIHINRVWDQEENGLIDKTSVQGRRRTKRTRMKDCLRLA